MNKKPTLPRQYVITKFSTVVKLIGRSCIDIENTYCSNNPKSKQYSEPNTDRCRKACSDDSACTGGYHWHQGDICYLFGVEGSVDNECKGRKKSEASRGFVCSGITGKKFNCFKWN